MSKYCGPRIRVLRRLGELPGFTTKTTTRNKTPGDHGKENKKIKRSTLSDDYRERLLEKQKLRYNYGVSEKQLVRYMAEAKRKDGSTELNLLQLLESRLDCLVFRLGFAKTIPNARQLINHGHISINHKKIRTPSFNCNIEDKITATNKNISKKLINDALKFKTSVPEHLSLDKDAMVGTLKKLPKRESLDLEINELKVIEYYSR